MGATEEQMESFPWIFCFIWKVRNEKAFNSEEILALDSVQWATSEALSWKMAQVVQSIVESDDETETSSRVGEDPLWSECQTDASWEKSDKVVGFGFTLINEDRSSFFGSKACRNVQSVLHAEMEALLWAMKNISDIGFTSIHIQTGCLQLLKMVKEEEEWLAFTAEIEEFVFLKQCFHVLLFLLFLELLMSMQTPWLRDRSTFTWDLLF